MISTPWAILLCKFNDNAQEPKNKQYYDDLFTTSGIGTQNMIDFFTDMSQDVKRLSKNYMIVIIYTVNQLSISSELRRLPVEIADLSQNNVNANVYDILNLT